MLESAMSCCFHDLPALSNGLITKERGALDHLWFDESLDNERTRPPERNF